MTMSPLASITSASALMSGSTATISPSSISTSDRYRSPMAGSMLSTVPPRTIVLFDMADTPKTCCEGMDSIGGDRVYGVDHLGDCGYDFVLERVGERQGHALGRHSPDRSVQRLEA